MRTQHHNRDTSDHMEQNHHPIKRALLIGIDYFGSQNQLSGCVCDIDDMQKWLSKHGFSEFTVLRDLASDPKHENRSCPTRANILSAMSAAVKKCQPGDMLYIHYSGHGAQLPDVNGDENDKKNGQDDCICPVDFDWNAPDNGFIRDDKLHEVLVTDLPKSVKLRVVFDSCHSGSALDLTYRFGANRFHVDSALREGKDI